MAEAHGQAPAGWYPDPHAPGQMRYFDGQVWTNHLHVPGRLPDIGEWLSSTFRVFGKHWLGALVLAFGSTLVASLAVALPALGFVNRLATEDFSVGWLVAMLIGLVAAVLIQSVGVLALNRFLQRAHYDNNPTIGEALQRGLSRLPKLLGVMLVLLGIFVAIAVVLVWAAVESGFLTVLFVLILIPVSIWAWVKLTFLPAAIAAAPKDAASLQASAGVSTGRFWPIFGRMLLITVVLFVGSQIISAAAGPLAVPVDQDAIGSIEFDSNGQLINDLDVADFIPATGLLIGALVLTSVIQSVSRIISTSAYMRLYLDSGGPNELVDG